MIKLRNSREPQIITQNALTKYSMYFQAKVVLHQQILVFYNFSSAKVKPDRWESTVSIINACASKVTRNIANFLLFSEDKLSQFISHIKHEKLSQKLMSILSFETSYSRISYPCGTIEIRRSDDK